MLKRLVDLNQRYLPLDVPFRGMSFELSIIGTQVTGDLNLNY